MLQQSSVYTQYSPIKNGDVKNQQSNLSNLKKTKGENLCFFGKFKEPVHKASVVEKSQCSL